MDRRGRLGVGRLGERDRADGEAVRQVVERELEVRGVAFVARLEPRSDNNGRVSLAARGREGTSRPSRVTLTVSENLKVKGDLMEAPAAGFSMVWWPARISTAGER